MPWLVTDVVTTKKLGRFSLPILVYFHPSHDVLLMQLVVQYVGSQLLILSVFKVAIQRIVPLAA